MRKEEVPQSDDTAYRDYLLECEDLLVTKFANHTDTEFGPPPPSKDDIRKQTLKNLKKRFKQDFGTKDNSVIGANRVAIEVLKAILVEDLGFDVNTIPVQGNFSDCQYLDDLIALSNKTTPSISSTYRIDLSRLDYEPTTRVRENILTLQSHLRDDKFNWGYNPFFLYKEEWRLHFQAPFFPENHYAFKTGLFATPDDRNRALNVLNTITSQEDYKPDFSRASSFVARLKILLNLDYNLTEGHRQFVAEEYGLARDYYTKAEGDVVQLAGQMWMKVYALPSDGNQIEETISTPSLYSAKQFRDSLYHEKNNWHLFGKRPPWNSDTWHTWTSPSNESHKGNWEKGLENGWWDPIDIANGKIPPQFPYTATLIAKMIERYDGRNTIKVDSVDSLDKLEARNFIMVSHTAHTIASYPKLETTLFDLHDNLVSLIPHVMFLMLPICQGDVASAIGDFPAAAKFYAQVAREQLLRGTLMAKTAYGNAEPKGDLPWTWVTPPDVVFNRLNTVVGQDYPYLNKDCELPFLLLRLGNLYLTWADQLYSIDKEPEVYRARELYKAVLRQYGIDPLPGKGFVPLNDHVETKRPSSAYEWLERNETQIKMTHAPVPAQIGPENTITEANFIPEAIEGFRIKVQKKGVNLISAGLDKEVSSLHPATQAVWEPLINAGLSPKLFAQPDHDLAFPFLNGALMLYTVKFITPINPAILALQTRARTGITQIDAGLNYYGLHDNLVPLLQYRSLATAAQHFATLASQAQADFLSYKKHAENEELGFINIRSAVATASLRVLVESQRILQAQDYVEQAKIQVQQVKDAIAEKMAEIEDGDSFCGQVKDFFVGIKNFFTGVPDKATSYIKSDYSSAFGFGNIAAGSISGLGVVGGMALFGVATGVTLSGIADKANQRHNELQKLQTQQLPMALAGLDARMRELTIAELQNAVANLEVLTAQEILRYSFLRTLNFELWTWMSSTIKSVLRRYLNLGAMTGWLAERALSYAQNRDVRLIRFDYFRLHRHGLLGADELQSDIALLEIEYITGLNQTVPIKWTVSLARDFPLQFGQLKAKGRCAFMTSYAPLDLAHPGFYNHRIHSVEIAAILPLTESPPRGLLSNPGVSRVAGDVLGNENTIVRPPDVFPLSEFRLKDDMLVYELPGKSLMPFEGSGMDTFWLLEFPAAANLTGLESLADICITFNLQASFSPSRRAGLAEAGAPTLTRSVLFSANKLFPESLKAFVDEGNEEVLEFAITHNLLPVNEKDRQVTNVGIFFLGKDLPEINGKLASDYYPQTVAFTTLGGLAHSNRILPQELIPVAADPLNVLAGVIPEQNWTLTIKDADNPILDRKEISDVILGIEYTTKPYFP